MHISTDNLALRNLLEEKYKTYANPGFIIDDPIQIPHKFSKKEDIEISAMLTATIAWGNRKSIVTNSNSLIGRMGTSPFDFIMNFSRSDHKIFSGFVHRTFNSSDTIHYINVLSKVYKEHGGLERVFSIGYKEGKSIKSSIESYRKLFVEINTNNHTLKHVPNVLLGSAAKRINLFLRWMVRSSKEGVDFGLWKGIPSSALMIPLDVHSGRIARELGLIRRNQSDWKSVEELTAVLREFDSSDPVKYDFALFGLGVNRKFS